MSAENPFLVVVDIQPGYHNCCHLLVPEVIEKMNNTEQQIIFFYVGKELDLDSKTDVIGYLLEHGLEENKIPGIKFIEKGYGFFRAWMDQGVSDEIIINSIKVMEEEQNYDSRDFTDDQWDTILGPNAPYNEKLHDDNIYYPDFDVRLFKHDFIDNFELIGGGRQECLKEIELYLKAIGKKVEVNESLCYGDNVLSYETTYKTMKRFGKN